MKNSSYYYNKRRNRKIIEECDGCKQEYERLLLAYQKRCMKIFGKPRMAGCGSQGRCPDCSKNITIN